MATKKNTTTNTTASASVNNLVDSAFVSDMESNKTRERLGDNQAVQAKWQSKEIVTYFRKRDVGADLFDQLDAELEEEGFHMPNGENDVILLGCTLVTETATRKQFLRMTIKSKATGAIEDVTLFPGNEYTDYQGKKIAAGHNWKAFFEEVKAQRVKDGIGMKPMGFSEFLKSECTTRGFRTWILYDGKYTNIYANYRKYQAALDRLARDQKKGK